MPDVEGYCVDLGRAGKPAKETKEGGQDVDDGDGGDELERKSCRRA